MARIRVGASARVPMTPVRVSGSVPVTPSSKTVFRVGPVICGIIAVVALVAWPLLVFHTTTYTPHCETNLITGRDCGFPPDEHYHVTSLGWTVEWAWLLVLLLVGRRVFRKTPPKAPKPARAKPVKAADGPRDNHLAPPVGMGKHRRG